MSAINELMRAVDWQPADFNTPPLGGRWATHSGILHFMGHDLRVYRLDTGESIIHADDFEALFGLDGDDDE